MNKILKLGLLFMFLIVLSSFAFGSNTIFYDDFDRVDSGTVDGGISGATWSEPTETGSCSLGILNDVMKGTGCSNGVMQLDLDLDSSTQRVSFKWRQDDGFKRNDLSFYETNGGTRIGAHTQGEQNLDWDYYDGGWTDAFGFVATTWYDIDILFDHTNNQFDMYVDDVLEVDNGNYENAGSVLNYIFWKTDGNNQGPTWYLDDFKACDGLDACATPVPSESPIFTSLTNLSVNYNTPINHSVSAYSVDNLASFNINNTNFDISYNATVETNKTAYISNSSNLEPSNYTINVCAVSSNGKDVCDDIVIEVIGDAPIFTSLTNLSVNYNTPINHSVIASSDDNIKNFSINNTDFDINYNATLETTKTAYISNSSSLEASNYSIEVCTWAYSGLNVCGNIVIEIKTEEPLRFESVYQVNQGDVVNINLNDTWTNIIQGNINLDANNTNYDSTTIQTLSTDFNTTFECRTLVNSIESGDNIVRTNIPDEEGSMTLLRPSINTSGNYNLEVQCKKNGGSTFIGFTNTAGHVFNSSVIYNDTNDSILVNGNNQSILSMVVNNSYDGYFILETSGSINSTLTSTFRVHYNTSDGQSCQSDPRSVGLNNDGAIGSVCAFKVNEDTPITIYGFASGNQVNFNYFTHTKILSFASSEPLILTTITDSQTLIGTTEINNTERLAKVFMKANIPVSDSSQNINLQFAVDGTLVGQQIPYTAGSDIKQSIQQFVSDAPDKDYFNISLYATSILSPITPINIEGGNILGYIANDYIINSTFFNVTAKNGWNNSVLNIFSVFDGFTNYSTTDGSISIFTNETFLNLTFSSNGFLNETYLNHNTSNDLEGVLYQASSKIKSKGLITNNSFSNFTLQTENGNYSTTNGTVNIKSNLDSYFWNISSNIFYNQSDVNFNINNTNLTLYFDVWDSIVNFTAIDKNDSTSISIFNLDELVNETWEFNYSTTNGYIEVLAEQGLSYFFNASTINYFGDNLSISNLNETYVVHEFSLLEIGDLFINVFDQQNSSLITQLIKVTVENGGKVENTFTGGKYTIGNLSLGTTYQISLNTTGYDDLFFNYDYTETSNKNLSLYLNQNGSLYTFTTLNQVSDVLPDVKISVYGYVMGVEQILSSRLTDGVGQTEFTLNRDDISRFLLEKDDYLTQDIVLLLNQFDYTINMQPITIIDYEGPVSGVYWTHDPKDSELVVNTNQTFNWSVGVEDVLISSFGIDIYFNGNLIDSTSSNSLIGGDLILTLDTTPYINETLAVTYFFEKATFERYELNKNYIINSEAKGNWYSLREYSRNNLSTSDKFITWYILIVLIGIMVAIMNLTATNKFIIIYAFSIFFAWLLAFTNTTEKALLMIQLSVALIGWLAYEKRRGAL